MRRDPEAAESHLRTAEAKAEDPAERARLVCLRANQAWERGDFDRAEALAEWARDLALQVGDHDDLAAAQEALAIVSHFRGDWHRGLEFEIERLHGDDARGGMPARVFEIHHCIGQYHLYEWAVRRCRRVRDACVPGRAGGRRSCAGVCMVPAASRCSSTRA
jgi:hypothetical protein